MIHLKEAGRALSDEHSVTQKGRALMVKLEATWAKDMQVFMKLCEDLDYAETRLESFTRYYEHIVAGGVATAPTPSSRITTTQLSPEVSQVFQVLVRVRKEQQTLEDALEKTTPRKVQPHPAGRQNISTENKGIPATEGQSPAPKKKPAVEKKENDWGQVESLLFAGKRQSPKKTETTPVAQQQSPNSPGLKRRPTKKAPVPVKAPVTVATPAVMVTTPKPTPVQEGTSPAAPEKHAPLPNTVKAAPSSPATVEKKAPIPPAGSRKTHKWNEIESLLFSAAQKKQSPPKRAPSRKTRKWNEVESLLRAQDDSSDDDDDNYTSDNDHENKTETENDADTGIGTEESTTFKAAEKGTKPSPNVRDSFRIGKQRVSPSNSRKMEIQKPVYVEAPKIEAVPVPDGTASPKRVRKKRGFGVSADKVSAMTQSLRRPTRPPPKPKTTTHNTIN
eukprot:TRINITY_DN1870_c0_g2_i1.p1 TRINITY_DN1870_c0_g2~~TRINITY_DN1870_c0_g2_i1.p1  ORF type:complete len:447 (+),score=89.71 TRINITY_DN1870_c0_g2_i1:799-2139(+)